jgi:RHS repeat-associated protein
MPVCEQEFKDGVLRTTRVNFLGARGIEAVLTIDHTRGNRASLSWLLYDGHGNLMRTMAPNYTLSAFQWRGVWGEVQGSLGTGRGYCANLGHPEDETGLVYMRARYYEPATGRFISEDPARDGANWYLYADGNPVTNADFDGRAPLYGALAALWAALSAAVGLALGYAVGYLFGIWEIRTFVDPTYSPPTSPFLIAAVGILEALGGGVVAYGVSQAERPFVHGYRRGVPLRNAIATLGPTGALGFLVGFTTGLTIAWLEYFTTP